MTEDCSTSTLHTSPTLIETMHMMEEELGENFVYFMVMIVWLPIFELEFD